MESPGEAGGRGERDVDLAVQRLADIGTRGLHPRGEFTLRDAQLLHPKKQTLQEHLPVPVLQGGWFFMGAAHEAAADDADLDLVHSAFPLAAHDEEAARSGGIKVACLVRDISNEALVYPFHEISGTGTQSWHTETKAESAPCMQACAATLFVS